MIDDKFAVYPSGAEKTRDELRIQVYDAMAEKEKTEVTAQELKSEHLLNAAEVKKENGGLTAPVTDGSEKPSTSSANSERSSSQEVNSGECPAGSQGMKEEDPKEHNGNMSTAKPEGGQDEESKSQAAQDEEEPEGSNI